MASFIYPLDKNKHTETQTIPKDWWDVAKRSAHNGKTDAYKSYVSNAVIIARGNAFEGIEAKS